MDDASALPRNPHSTLLPALQQALQQEAVPALYWQNQCLTRALLQAKSRQLQQQLLAAGITRGKIVGVLLPRCPEALVLLLALWQCGAVYLPLDPAWPAARLESALQLAAADALISSPELQSRCSRCSCPLLLLPTGGGWQLPDAAAETEPGSAGSDEQQHWPQPADTAYLLFTSGSSGSPKAVQVSHAALYNLFSGLLPLLALPSDWRLLGCTSVCFDIVFFEWLAPLLAGGSLVLADDASQRDPARLLHLVQRHDVNVVQATPSLWRLLLQESVPALKPGQLQLAIATGEALDSWTAARLLELGQPLWNLYGPTECTLWSSARRVQADDLAAAGSNSISIGQALPGYSFRLLPHPDCRDQHDCGELLISGPGVADGYLGATAEQQQRFALGADGTRSFRSGDLCRRDAAGNYHFLQRCDSQLKINGQRIEAGEIETLLRSHPGIVDAACLARQLEGGSQLLACVVCAAGSPNKNRERWNRHLARWLPEWMLPQRYLVVAALPLDANGKLDRQALLQLAEQGDDREASNMDALERAVAAIFCSVLQIDSIGPCDSFFDLGGNSMLAATLLLATNQHFGSNLRLRELLQSPPTVQRVGALLRQAGMAAAPAE
jgi:enterobactin synthetase component F